MSDNDVTREIEANESRAAGSNREEGTSGLEQTVNDAVGSLFAPAGFDTPDEDEEQDRRELNDAEQRPE